MYVPTDLHISRLHRRRGNWNPAVHYSQQVHMVLVAHHPPRFQRTKMKAITYYSLRVLVQNVQYMQYSMECGVTEVHLYTRMQ